MSRQTPDAAPEPAAGPVRVAVLASGEGTNLQALLDAARRQQLAGARVVLVLSDRPGARALQRAAAAGVPAQWLDPGRFSGREAYDRALLERLAAHRVDLVALAGFMRLLGRAVVDAYPNRIMNVHPSLLPAFPGRRAVQEALAHGVRVSGCTVHFVDHGMDTGPIILQEPVPVRPDDDARTLRRRIQAVEHRLYPQAVRLFAEGRLRVAGRRVSIKEVTG